MRTIAAFSLLVALAGPAFAEQGELTCAQYTKQMKIMNSKPKDAADARLSAICAANPKLPARVAMERAYNAR